MNPILVWVDAFETFYQMPEKAFEEFQETESYEKLLELGYSVYDYSSYMKFKDKSTNQLNELKAKL
jgi:hypothetical protein